MKFFKHLLLALFVAGTFMTVLPGCETVEGAGEDIENLGEGTQDAAN